MANPPPLRQHFGTTWPDHFSKADYDPGLEQLELKFNRKTKSPIPSVSSCFTGQFSWSYNDEVYGCCCSLELTTAEAIFLVTTVPIIEKVGILKLFVLLMLVR